MDHHAQLQLQAPNSFGKTFGLELNPNNVNSRMSTKVKCWKVLLLGCWTAEDEAPVETTTETEQIAICEDGTKNQCATCYQTIKHATTFSVGCSQLCKHMIGLEYLQETFENAIGSESAYPPRYCGPIPFERFEHLLDTDFVAWYQIRRETFHIDVRCRQYCGDEKCHIYLTPDDYQQTPAGLSADCMKCGKSTRIICMLIVPSHNPHTNWLPFHQRMINRTQQNWSFNFPDEEIDPNFRLCPYCHEPGSHDNACNNMTCGCGEQWCWICSRQYNSTMDHKECRYYYEHEFDNEGYYATGFHRLSGEDREGYNREGFNAHGVYRNGKKVMGYVRGRIRAGQCYKINKTFAEQEADDDGVSDVGDKDEEKDKSVD